jgi:ankyrin repeat protein
MNLRKRNSFIILVAGAFALLLTVYNHGGDTRIRQRLDRAISSGDVDQVREILSKSPKQLNLRDKSKGATVLHVAAEAGRADIAELLIGKGADINVETKAGWTPLHRAVDMNHPAVAKLLISKGADVNATGKGNAPLHRAAFSGNLEMLQILLDEGADIHARGAEGWTAIFFACCGGHLDAVEMLISSGASIVDSDDAGRTPLDVATTKGHNDVAQFLRRRAAAQ